MNARETENPLAAFSNSMAQAAEAAGAYTLTVLARRRLPSSGVLTGADLVLTADHSVEAEEDLAVILADGSQVKASLAGRDPSSDLALLRLERAIGQPAGKAPDQARVGQLAVTIGRPGGDVQAGLAMIHAVGGPVRTRRGGLLQRYYHLDSIPYPGFSGGPLVDASGLVLGINTSGLAVGTLVSIPAELAWQTAETLAQYGRIRRGYLGVRSQPVEIPAAARAALGREQKTGLLLVSVDADSPAAQGGLMVGDILIALNLQSINEADDLLVRLSQDAAGQIVPVQVVRGGQVLTLDIKVGER